jgi:radical SAM protein with 4Fe4S-binding SPASM domain
MNAVAIEKQSMSTFLLNEKDYLIINSKGNDYLFLSDSLRYFKVTNMAVKEYLRLCKTKDIDETFLSEDEIMTISDYLKQAVEEEDKTIHPNVFHNFLILNLTSGCNLSCKYCFAETTQKHKTMSLPVAKKAIDNMLSQKGEANEYSIYFFGGEPLLKKELVRQITEYAYHEITQKRNKKIIFRINTNATLIDDAICLLFKHYDFRVTVSIDGPMEEHDTNRIYANGSGSYEVVMKNISLLKAHQITTNLRATFNPKARNLVSIFDFFEKMALPYAYSFTLNSEYKSNAADTHFADNQFEVIDKELTKSMDYFVSKIANREHIFCTEIISKLITIKHKQMRTHSCEAGRTSLTVDENGSYFACQNMLPYRQSILGNVNSGIDQAVRRKFMSKALRELSGCTRCAIRNLCVGGCEVERINAYDKSGAQTCKLARIEWKNILYAYARITEMKAHENKKTIEPFYN